MGDDSNPGLTGRQRVYVQDVTPRIDGGKHAVKRTVGERLVVEADVLVDGHDQVRAELLLLAPGESTPRRVGMKPLGSDRFTAEAVVDRLGRWSYLVEGWVDHFTTWRLALAKRREAGQPLSIELHHGAALVEEAAAHATSAGAPATHGAALTESARRLADDSLGEQARAAEAEAPILTELMLRYPVRAFAARSSELPLRVERVRARFSAWYEMFPRSARGDGTHATLRDAEARLPYVRAMGFDILYLPPIHPIGTTFRKGKDNAPTAAPDDVGSPWAIGGPGGGHKSVHEELGTLADFEHFVARAEEHDLEVALDIALQVSPDHPYVREHPEWFKKRPDGSIQYAENPPKKYQDIYPFDFECEAWESLWHELKSIFEFWIARGVRVFRVDNPHTKSLRFWAWCLAELFEAHPDVIFLAEAFTRPKIMYQLAKIGFSQSYTYFTWRNSGAEFIAYLHELTRPDVRTFYRPNFWPNTPDILPEHLQYAGQSAFQLRLLLAATLSSNYGIYGPAFEQMANVPRQGVEEYAENEKYELKRWAPPSAEDLSSLIATINAVRNDNPALQYTERVHFHATDNEMLLCFSKRAPDDSNVVLVVVNLDVHHVQSGWVALDLAELGMDSPRGMQMHDLLTGDRYLWSGARNYVRLDPARAPGHVFRLRRYVRTEHDFDYFV